jgi:hypothetical protein
MTNCVSNTIANGGLRFQPGHEKKGIVVVLTFLSAFRDGLSCLLDSSSAESDGYNHHS